MNRSKSARARNRSLPENRDDSTGASTPWFLAFLRSPWSAVIFVLPFVLMLSVHQWLGLSDALLAADEPGTRPAHGYNLALGVLMTLSPLPVLHHLLVRSQRGLPWIIGKMLILMMIFLLGFLAL